MLSAMSAPGATEIVAVLALFAGFGSFTALLTAAVFAMMPSALVVALSVTVAFPPLTSVPSEQLTRPALWPHVPCDPLALWNTPPFDPHVADGVITARGASDNKGQIMAHIQGVAEVLSRELEGYSDPEIQKLRIKVSGCPNSCGHHHIADIGFYGNARKIGEQQAPYYQLLLGGKVNSDGVRFGRQIMAVPVRPIPRIIRELLTFYQADRQLAESFTAWVSRTPDKTIKDRLRPWAEVTPATADLFLDWGDTETYSLKLGRGECVA